MRVIIVESDRSFAQVLQGILENAGYQVKVCDRTEAAAVAILSFEPTIALIDVSMPTHGGIELVRTLRRDGNSLPVVLMSSPNMPLRERAALDGLQVERELLKPFSLLGLVELLEEVALNTLHVVEDENISEVPIVDPEGLETIAQIWREGRSGVLRLAGDDHWAVFSAGDPVGQDGFRMAKTCIQSGGGSFHELDVSGSGSVHSLATLLWNSALLLGTSMPIKLDRVLSFSETAERLPDLPLSLPLTSLVFSKGRERYSLLVLCQTIGLDFNEIRSGLGALLQLKLCSLEEKPARPNDAAAEISDASSASLALSQAIRARRAAAARRARRARPNSPRPRRERAQGAASEESPSVSVRRQARSRARHLSSAEGSTSQTGSSQTAGSSRPSVTRSIRGASAMRAAQRQGRSEQERLQRELRLLQGADDWTVLGVSSGASETHIQQSIERMLSRYQRIQEDRSQSEEVRSLAASILQLIEASASRVFHPRARMVSRTANHFTQAMHLGQDALEKGQFQQASRYFMKARQQEPNSGRALGLLGWSIYNDDQREQEAREQEGLELLQLADTFDSNDDDLQYYLAVAERRTGNIRRARARLRRLLGRSPEHVGARTLLGEVVQVSQRQES